jgi:hypothetical protein
MIGVRCALVDVVDTLHYMCVMSIVVLWDVMYEFTIGKVLRYQDRIIRTGVKVTGDVIHG